MRKDSFLAVCHTDVHPSSFSLVRSAVWLGWFVCCYAPVALISPFLSILLSALFVHLSGTYYVEASSGPRCLKNEDKILISLPICKLRSPGSLAPSGPDRMLSWEPTSEPPWDRNLSGESRNIINKSENDDAESISSSDDSRPQFWENASETTSNSDVWEIAIHSLFVEKKQRGLDR